jgi:3-phenylpropionate/trans-cinnamate dioxygenase ferredoxin subunit
MADWVRVARAETLPPGARLTTDIDGVSVLLVNLDGAYCALENICSHDGGELASGAIEGDEIVCPRHGARFKLRTGAVSAPPAYVAVASLPVRVTDGWIEVRDDRWD